MTPKEKAWELYLRYYNRIGHTLSDKHWPHEATITKECTLIAVYEILHELDHTPILDDDYCEWKMNYWNEVKQEIEKL